jgi:transposase
MDKVNEVIEVIIGEYTKSEKVRKLYVLGVSVKNIAKVLNISYNFAYNVVAEYKKQR